MGLNLKELVVREKTKLEAIEETERKIKERELLELEEKAAKKKKKTG